jgi:hypothetical protein
LQLWRLTRELQLQPSSAVFLNAEKLAQAVRDKKRSAGEREEIRQIAQTLFGNSVPESMFAQRATEPTTAA